MEWFARQHGCAPRSAIYLSKIIFTISTEKTCAVEIVNILYLFDTLHFVQRTIEGNKTVGDVARAI